MLKLIYHMRELDFHSIVRLYKNDSFEAYDVEYRFAAEHAFCHYLREVLFTIKDAFYAVWIERNQYIAVLHVEPYRDGMLLEALETSQKNRRQGYAT